jgi:hypothetical protein
LMKANPLSSPGYKRLHLRESLEDGNVLQFFFGLIAETSQGWAVWV